MYQVQKAVNWVIFSLLKIELREKGEEFLLFIQPNVDIFKKISSFEFSKTEHLFDSLLTSTSLEIDNSLSHIIE